MTFEERLGYRFADRTWLDRARVHRSWVAEHPESESNERMEFLGDAVLQLVVTEYLYAEFGGLAEGQMAKVRAACVNRDVLARIARDLGLNDVVLLGHGEEMSQGRSKDSILADACEAVLAAVYLDGGLEAARRVIQRHWIELIREKARQPGAKDYKTRLQEVLAARSTRPEYVITGSGPDHAREFTARVLVDGREVGSGRGGSKKAAEQAAARAGLESMGG